MPRNGPYIFGKQGFSLQRHLCDQRSWGRTDSSRGGFNLLLYVILTNGSHHPFFTAMDRERGEMGKKGEGRKL